jgi:hypothetical protein
MMLLLLEATRPAAKVAPTHQHHAQALSLSLYLEQAVPVLEARAKVPGHLVE